MEFKTKNKSKAEQTATAEKYPQRYFKDKPCKQCSKEFTPKAPSEHYCSDKCKDLGLFDNYLFRNYGIGLVNYEEIYSNQEGKCAICNTDGVLRAKASKSDMPLVVDHDHITGKVRGLLCHTCNTALGQFKDSKELLNIASEYLDSELILKTPIPIKSVKVRASNISKDDALAVITDRLDKGLKRKELMDKYNLSEARVRSIIEGKTQAGKKALERYYLIKESATTIPNGSTSQANGDGSGSISKEI